METLETSSTDCLGTPAPQRGYVDAGALRLSYLVWGASGRPLVLLHGITSSARTWWRVAPELTACGYLVYGFDMPGHGESDSVGTHAIDYIAGLIKDACGILQLGRPAIVGHSWGGATALALAGSMPAERVLLIDPLLAMTPEAGASRLDYFLDGVGQPRAETAPKLRATNSDWHACDVAWKAEALEQCREAAVRGLLLGTGEWSLIERLAQIDAPLLMLLADPQNTIVAPPLLAAAQAAFRPGLAESVVVPGTTHNMVRGNGYDPTMRVILPWMQLEY